MNLCNRLTQECGELINGTGLIITSKLIYSVTKKHMDLRVMFFCYLH